MLLNTISNVDAIFISKYLHSVVEGRPPYHPPLGRHPFPSYAAFPGAASRALLRSSGRLCPSVATARAGRLRETRRHTSPNFGVRYNLAWTQRRMEISVVEKTRMSPTSPLSDHIVPSAHAICIASLGRMSVAAALSPRRQAIIRRVASPTRFVIINTAAPPGPHAPRAA